MSARGRPKRPRGTTLSWYVPGAATMDGRRRSIPDPGTDPPPQAVIFISHRHEDKPVAQRLQQTLKRLLGDLVIVFNTSDADAAGIPAGQPVVGELHRMLARASLVILLYTTDEGDWRWPFYECGVAMDPTDRTPTKTVVFDFQTAEGSRVFEGDKHLVLDPSYVHDGAAPDDLGVATFWRPSRGWGRAVAGLVGCATPSRRRRRGRGGRRAV